MSPASPPAEDYRVDELMIAWISGRMDDSRVTVLGSFTPLAYAAYMLAKVTHAPNAYLVGFNSVGMPPVEMNITSVEAEAYRGAVARWTFCELTNTIHLGNRGLLECISPAQIDGTGAFNTSAIGDYEKPKVRLPGGTGSPEVAQNYERIVAYFGTHDRRALVERVDFATGGRSPIDDAKRRERGLLTGPIEIITPLCVLLKDTAERPFRIESLHPGATVEQVVENTGFEIEVPDRVPTTAEPTEEQVRLLREKVDPFGTSRFDFLGAAGRAEYVQGILDREWARAEALVEGS